MKKTLKGRKNDTNRGDFATPEGIQSITSFEAFTEYGATRLSAIIFNLRKNHIITDEWIERTNRFGENVRFKKYLYVKEI